MDELNFTLGDAEKLAEQRLLWQKQKKPADREQDSLFQDSEQARADSIPTQDEAGDARPHGVPCPAPAPSKDSEPGSSASSPAADDAGAVTPHRASSPAPEYDPRTSDWQGF